ncbi:hypothetical protein CFR75_15925 [Komagataeibacter xylinus]|uniref:Uncharacterized protein n=1 Tax=Komagataeibacter xylinus TaxID=28448 RepID=A0A318PE88_KOMXY|nr:hypothetical protein [Komagataeibacter xylinus]AZV38198.1 hypothetical protein CXP35_04600 [Komagataeibacter xylinus]PYD55541.1 hypothetical protein CFR75_15925 [Komagataeibacter xylinus]GBQ68034.1 hypothetical protein AA15237_0296 [Komagataeibacter xylinus NBRC 15237]
MTDKPTAAAREHMHKLAARGLKEPKLLQKEEVIAIAQHVAKEHGRASGTEHEIAKKAEHNPEGVSAAEIQALCAHVTGERTAR